MEYKPVKHRCKALFFVVFFRQLVLIRSDGVFTDQTPDGAKLSCSQWSCTKNIHRIPLIVSRRHLSSAGCACDQYCGIVGDCCMDYNSNSDDDEMETLNIIEPHLRCVQDSTVANEDGFLAVVSCPQSWLGSETEVLCKSDNVNDLMLRLPVTGNHSGLVYRNLYCALCHDEPYQLWRPTVDCRSRTPLNLNAGSNMREILENRECRLRSIPPDKEGQYRPCIPDAIKHCAPNFKDTAIASQCETSTYMQPVYSDTGMTFYNDKCALCNYQSPLCQKKTFPTGPDWKLYSFSILFDLNTNTGSMKVGSTSEESQEEVNITHTCSSIQVYDPFIQQCRRVYRASQLDDVISFNLNNTTSNITIDCPRLQLNGSEFAISRDGTLETVSGYTYDKTEYDFDGVYAYVCTNLTQNFTETVPFIDTKIEFNFTLTSAIVTSIGLCVSLLGLLATMGVYAVIKVLRNIPGKILLSLTTSLFFANLAVLLAPRAESLPTLCKVIAALMHYLFLDAFLWMNVMAADVWFTFSKSFVKAGDGGKSSKRFTFYNVYVRGVAIVLVTAAVTVDNVVSESQFKPNYGRGLCWITNKRGLLVFFAVPLFLLICLNFGFFSIASKNILDAEKQSAAYLGKGVDFKFRICAKLAVVMGLTLVLGFLASMFPYTVIWYTYIIFNTFQGLFICVAFVCTRKVFNLLRDWFSNLRRPYATTDRNLSSPTRSADLS
ncbi:adhesion G protein-coupled receptor L3-like [Haliotis cracherodii]|uniref:adhesion G protein-coupled receptor L3-like n=1 Tax=Haliotis cracherodii TaxID=6455 RepID=UPI0039EBB4D4